MFLTAFQPRCCIKGYISRENTRIKSLDEFKAYRCKNDKKNYQKLKNTLQKVYYNKKNIKIYYEKLNDRFYKKNII